MLKNPKPKLLEDIVEPFSYPIKGKIKLLRPSSKYCVNFFDLTLTRRSARNFTALLPNQLDILLWYGAKAIDTYIQSNNYILSRRPSASAGARHPIDILVCARSPLSIAYYNPFEHTLNQLDYNSSILNDLMNHVNENIAIQDGTFLWLIAHFPRTAAKYDNAESLIWRDAGALLHQLQLTASSLKINSCCVGTLGEPFIKLLEPSANTISAGGIIIGNEGF